jgi:hypothetical protein
MPLFIDVHHVDPGVTTDDELRIGPATTAATGSVDADGMRLVRHQRYWVLSSGERRAVVEDLVGIRYLARLLGRPGVPVRALELAGGGGPVPPEPQRQAVVDPAAVAAYRDRARRLVDELTEARERGDLARFARLELEADALADQLDRSTDVFGRSREFTGPAERARVAVRKAIKRAMDRIAEADPAIGRELHASVSTGHTCCYLPAAAAARQ